MLTLIKAAGMPAGSTDSMYFFKSWSKYSNTRYSRFSLCTTSCSLAPRRHHSEKPRVGGAMLVHSSPNNIGVLQLLEERDLSDRRAGHSLVLLL